MDRKKLAPSVELETVAGIDIGSNNISAFVGRVVEGQVEVIGLGETPSLGLRNGMLVNIDATVSAIRTAVTNAESVSGIAIEHAFVSVSGDHLHGRNLSGSTRIKNGEIRQVEIDEAIDTAKAISLAAGEQVLHILPQEFVIDNQIGLREPLGIAGVRVEAHVHLITCASNAVLNISKCMELCGIEIEGFIAAPLAAAHAVLSPDDLNLGVCLLDIGGGTTDVVVYVDGSLQHTSVVNEAGESVTKDIAMTLRTPPLFAEELKVMYACASQDLVNQDEQLLAPGIGDRPSRELSRYTLTAVVEAKYRKIFETIKNDLDIAGLKSDKYSLGVVMTGGASRLEGAVELAEETFHLPVSLGHPVNILEKSDYLRNPAYATGVGLMVFGQQSRQEGLRNHQITERWWSPAMRWIRNNV